MTATMQFAETNTPTEVAKGWHDDPFNQHDLRFHDGKIWTEHVTHFGPVPCQGCRCHGSDDREELGGCYQC